MEYHDDFWLRPVTGQVTIELVPGDYPCLRINCGGHSVAQLELMEARELIEVLTVAVGELYILKRDPAALKQLRRLLERDATLTDVNDVHRSSEADARIKGHIPAQEFIQQYQQGMRDFPRAYLRLANLRGANLPGVDLRDANLSGAILKRANLFQANLENADLARADLQEAGLFQANLKGANLSNANLHRAYLAQANLVDAIVSNDQLAQVRVLKGATMPDGTKLG